MEDTIKKHIRKARSVLISNRSSHYTLPSSSLYPHQWNWDSGFIAIGYSHFDTDWAIKELRSLFDAQWKNGMLPQIVFNRKRLGSYFPEPDFWITEKSIHAPDDHLTSGITMPPIHAVAALKIYENARDKDNVKSFFEWLYPKLLNYHTYLYNERSYNHTGLIYIRHPWESGMDNSPSWDRVLSTIDLSETKLPSYQRKDLSSGVSADMRPTSEYYDYFVYLVELFKRAKYDERVIEKDCPFLVCDPLFNAILCASNEALITISSILKKPFRDIEEWYNLTSRAIREKLYHEDHGIFDAYNIRDGKFLELETASGFMPLFGGAASPVQAARIYEYLDSKSFCSLHQGNCFTIPSYDTQKKDFKRENYWRGPVWLNINWMLTQGLRRYGFIQKADALARHIMELPIRFGFYEYYDSFDGRGYGSKHFSWSAALFIDTAFETYIKTKAEGLEEMTKKIIFKQRVLNEFGKSTDITGIKISQEMLNAIKQIKANYYTPQGTVDYESIKTSYEYSEYKKITANLREFDLSLLKEEKQKLAFWINLYNTIVVDGIIEGGIKESVREAVGFFKKMKYLIGGYLFSPDDIEHGILRANRKKPSLPWRHFGLFNPKRKFSLKEIDPRIHFALVCGSRSCAPIKYYTPEGIHDELELATESFVNSSEVMVIPEENRILISQIFKWYRDDFGGISGIIDFLNRYILDEDKKNFIKEKKRTLRINYLYYDWSLNK